MKSETDYMMYAGKRVKLQPLTPRQLKGTKHIVQKIANRIVGNEVAKGNDPFTVLAMLFEKWHEHVGELWEELFDDLIMLLSMFSGVDEETLWDTPMHEHADFINRLLEINQHVKLKKNMTGIKAKLQSALKKPNKS